MNDREVFVSWNGATEVGKRGVQGSRGSGMDFEAVVEVNRTGFETSVNVYCKKWLFVMAVALDASSAEIGFTWTI